LYRVSDDRTRGEPPVADPADLNVPRPGRRRALRIAWIVVGVVVVLAVAYLLVGRRLLAMGRIRQLYAEDPKARQAAREALVADGWDGLNDLLVDDLGDTDVSFSVRVTLGHILLDRQRLQRLEAALASGDLDTRSVVLAVLYTEKWFKTSTYLDDPRYHVHDTVLAWLRREGDASRATAVDIAMRFGMDDAAPLLREMIRDPRPAEGHTDPLVMVAARALVSFHDCEAVPRFVPLAREDGDDLVRMRLMQALAAATVGEHAPCPGAVPEDTVRQIVYDNLGAGENTRAASLFLLREHPDWAAGAEDALFALLDSKAEGNVRRSALSALAEGGGKRLAGVLRRYFHDPDQYVRSGAVAAAQRYARDAGPVGPFTASLIGIVRDEHENLLAFEQATEGLRDAAGRWLDLPENLVSEAARNTESFRDFRKELFERGESHGVDRDAWATTWFRWLADARGLDTAAVDGALAAREAFWQAAGAVPPDVAGARAALERAPKAKDLYGYEEGWLAVHGG
jgi:hypothetical protein